MDIKKAYATDREKEKNGTWEDFGDGLKVLIARLGNPNYIRKFREVSKPFRKAIKRETFPEEKAEKIFIETMAHTIVLGWEGLEIDGKPVEYSVANAIQILTDYPDFKEQINEVASTMETFKLVADEEAEKNSKAS